MTHRTDEAPTDDLLDEIINAYLEARQTGREPDRKALLATYPGLVYDLERFFDAHDAIERLSRPLRDVAQATQLIEYIGVRNGPVRQVPIPVEFGAYVLFEVLGSGGMGVVYRAHHRILNREVALKQIITGPLASADDVQRFRNEAEAAAQLEHPNIVPIHDVGEYQGRHYLTMRLIEGGSLADHRERFLDDPRAAARLIRIVAGAVHHAHQHGILHRDLKPSNILLDRDGQPHVTDFGLARRIGVESTLTGSGAILGSPPYMAPEQAGGRMKETTTATDVYGLGAILYVLLTGRPPFRGESVLDTMEQVRSHAPEPPRRENPRVDRDLETIVLKAMAKEPADRFASAEEMAEELLRFLRHEPLRSRPVPARDRLWRWCHRNPLVACLAGGIVVALVLGTAVSTTFAIRASGNAAEARAQARRADEAARQARDEKLISDRQLYVAEIQLAQQAWRDGRSDMVQHHIRMLEPKRAEDSDLRNFEWYYLDRLSRTRGLHTLRGHTSSVRGVAYSPDGHTLASGSMDSMVKLWDTATGREIRTLGGHSDELYGVAFSPDGRTLASASKDRTVKLWETATGREIRTLPADADAVRCLAFSPDGRLLAAAGHAGVVRIRDAATGQEVRELPGQVTIYGVAFSPDGHTLASAGHDHSVKLWDAATGREVNVLRGHTDVVRWVAFSPGGRFLASASGDLTVKLWDAATGREVRTLRGHTQVVTGVAFSPDGRLIASCSDDNTARLWDAATGREVNVLRGHAEQVCGVAFSPDGRTLACSSYDHTLTIWDAFASQDARTLRGHMGSVWGVAYSPDGRTLASTGEDGTIRLWDADTGREVRALRGHTGTVRCARFSPDGRSIASSGEDWTVRIWDAATGQELYTMRKHKWIVECVAFSPDGRSLASASEDSTIGIWEVGSGKAVTTLRGHTGPVTGVAYSPDGRMLASSGDDLPIRTMRLWDATTWQAIRTLSATEGKPRREPVFMAVAFRPDGRRFAAACWDSTLRIWDAATGEEILCLRGHNGGVSGLAYSPDGQRLASAGSDSTARLWNAATGQEVLTLRGHESLVVGVAFRPDGHQIATTSRDQTVRIWDARPLDP
jgi:eukaryotic-like serine/threonine-protein kinase